MSIDIMATAPQEVLDLLRAAGWSPTREVDIAPYIPLLEEEGSTVSDAAKAFLQRYVDLRIPIPREISLPEGRTMQRTETLMFDVMFFNGSLGPEVIAMKEQRLHTPLCQIGFWDGHQTWLFMAPSGDVYGVWGDSIIHCGSSGDEAVINMISGKNIKQLPPG